MILETRGEDLDVRIIKDKLNKDMVINILTTIGCDNVKNNSKTIQASNPDGDNPTAICIYKDNWRVENFTRPDFNNMKIKDIISLVQFIENTSFYNAIKRVCDICEFDFYKCTKRGRNTKVKLMDKYIGNYTEIEDDIPLTPIPKSTLKQFVYKSHDKWLREGISAKAMHKFKIGYDIDGNSITIPIYDEIGSLVGVKVRNLDEDPNKDKYYCIYPFPKTQILYGLYQNYENIKKKNQIIVVESEKSVIKLWGKGYKNAVALCGKTISNTQAEKIIRAEVKDVVLCMDKDVTQKEIDFIVDKINKPIKMCNVYIMKDDLDFMSEKESPTDNMDTWQALWSEIILEGGVK